MTSKFVLLNTSAPSISVDLETRSALNLKKVHAWTYAGHTSTDASCAGFAADDGPINIWTPGQPIPEVIIRAVAEGWTFRAFNAAFEMAIWRRILAARYGWPEPKIEQWRCTMAAALANALPAALDDVAEALHLPIRKDAEGHKLMLKMAQPRKPRKGEDPAGIYWQESPEELERLCKYCKRDVEVEREVYRRVPALSDSEQALWVLDRTINRRGFAVDVPLALAGKKIVDARRAGINKEVTEITAGAATTINQRDKILAFINARGHSMTGFTKRHVSAVLAHNPGPEVERLLRLRQEGGKASVSKLSSLLAAVDQDRLHDTTIFHKAATGRWAGSGFQPQNLLRETPKDEAAAIAAVLSGELDQVASIGAPLDVIASLSRSLITAPPGYDLISGDFSAIESRLTAFFANETWKLDNYREYDRAGNPALEPYCVVATKVLGHTVTPDNEDERQLGKLLDLAFGFGGGAGAFKRIAPDSDFDDDEIEQFKKQYRAAHPATCHFWKRLGRMLKRVVRSGKPDTLGNIIRAEMRDGNLYMVLLSGRSIVYPEARIVPGKYGEEIAFKNNRGWRETSEWFGTFVENLVQGTARDLLATAMQRVEAAGYPVVLHVHDEIICEVPEHFGSVKEFQRLITSDLPEWAAGLPFTAKVSRRKRYAKIKKKEAA